MTDNATKRLHTIINKILVVESENIQDSLAKEDIEDWDSMSHLILMSEIEQEFDVVLSDEELTSINSIKDIKQVLTTHGITF